MPGRVYHWKHGWIPLDHVAAVKKYGKNGAIRKGFKPESNTPSFAPVSYKDLPRQDHIVATHNASTGEFNLHDKQSGHKATMSMSEADKMQARGARVVRINDGGQILKLNGPKTLTSAEVAQQERDRIQAQLDKTFKKIPNPSHEDAFRHANEDYNPQKLETYINCAKTVQAYELRRRGYDVKASLGSASLTSSSLRNLWEDDNGRPPSPMVANTIEELDKLLEKDPPGARYHVLGTWADGKSAHIWSAEKMPNGKIKYFDSQVREPNVPSYIKKLKKPPGVQAFRVDNMNPRKRLLEHRAGTTGSEPVLLGR